MNSDEKFFYIWNRIEGLDIPEQSEYTICDYASDYHDWIVEILKIYEKPDIISINQAKILVTDKFSYLYRTVPQSHRQRLGTHGHTCIFQVFIKTYVRLQFVELSLMPPLIFHPQNPPPPPPPLKPPNIAGLFIGQGLDDDE